MSSEGGQASVSSIRVAIWPARKKKGKKRAVANHTISSRGSGFRKPQHCGKGKKPAPISGRYNLMGERVEKIAGRPCSSALARRRREEKKRVTRSSCHSLAQRGGDANADVATQSLSTERGEKSRSIPRGEKRRVRLRWLLVGVGDDDCYAGRPQLGPETISHGAYNLPYLFRFNPGKGRRVPKPSPIHVGVG